MFQKRWRIIACMRGIILYRLIYSGVPQTVQFYLFMWLFWHTPSTLKIAKSSPPHHSKHTSNSGFDRSFMPCSGYILFAAEQQVGYQISWVDLQREETVREICRATYRARQARLLISQRRRQFALSLI